MSPNTDWLRYTQVMTLELSNLCNYAGQHAKCPAHYIQEPQILPAETVQDVCDTLAERGFGPGKWLAFHVYNEPLMDPRLFKFVEHARRSMPDVGMILWSNGWFLRESLAEELVDAGITHVMVSAYSDAEYERLHALRDWLRQRLEARPTALPWPFYLRIRRVSELDDRLQRQSLPAPESRWPCYQPLSNLTIRADGTLGLCCYDWGQEVRFGDVAGARFGEWMAEHFPQLEQLYLELVQGERRLAPCQPCRTPRRPACETLAFYWPESTLVSKRVPSDP